MWNLSIILILQASAKINCWKFFPLTTITVSSLWLTKLQSPILNIPCLSLTCSIGQYTSSAPYRRRFKALKITCPSRTWTSKNLLIRWMKMEYFAAFLRTDRISPILRPKITSYVLAFLFQKFITVKSICERKLITDKSKSVASTSEHQHTTNQTVSFVPKHNAGYASQFALGVFLVENKIMVM